MAVGVWALGPSLPAEKEHSKAWESLHAEVVRGGGDVVLLGNSTSHSDIERVTVAKALGVPTLTNPLLPGSGAAGFLAVLEGQIAAENIHPRLVLVYGTLETLLGWRSPPGHVAQAIDELIASGDTRVGRRVFGVGRGGVRSRFTANWSGTQSELVNGLRDRAVGAVFRGGDGESLAERGASVAEPALEALFGDQAELRTGAGARILPVQEASGDLSFSTTVPAVESLVPDLVAVAHGLGARIVFIRGPDAPTRKPTPVLAAQAEPLRQLLDALGAGYADVSDAGVSPSNYHDAVHMNAENRSIVTAAVVDELARLDPLGAETMAASRRPVRLTGLRRIGEPPSRPIVLVPAGECRWSGPLAEAAVANPALVAAGVGTVSPLLLRVGDGSVPLGGAPLPAGCALGAQFRAGRLTVSAPADAAPGDFWLDVEASEAAGWVFPETALELELDLQGATTLRVALRAFGAATVSARVGDTEIQLVSRGDLRDGVVELAPGAVRVTVRSTGGYALVEAVEAGRDGRSRTLLGGFDDRVALRHAWPGDPVPWPTPAARREGEVDVYDLPALAVVADDVLTASGLTGCSLLDVSVAGQKLLHRQAARRDATGGSVNFEGGILRVPAGLGPVTLALRGPRRCDPVTWLYPGETRTGRSGLVDLGSLRSGASALEFVAERWGGEPGVLTVQLGTEREGFVTAEVPVESLDGTPVRVPLPVPRVGVIRHAQLTFINGSASFVAVRSAALTDPTAATP